MLVIPDESLQLHRVVASAMSRHTFALIQPSKHGVENQEIATGVGVKWKGQYLSSLPVTLSITVPRTRSVSFCQRAT
jgi:hypothetical protein